MGDPCNYRLTQFGFGHLPQSFIEKLPLHPTLIGQIIPRIQGVQVQITNRPVGHRPFFIFQIISRLNLPVVNIESEVGFGGQLRISGIRAYIPGNLPETIDYAEPGVFGIPYGGPLVSLGQIAPVTGIDQVQPVQPFGREPAARMEMVNAFPVRPSARSIRITLLFTVSTYLVEVVGTALREPAGALQLPSLPNRNNAPEGVTKSPVPQNAVPSAR